MTEPTGTLTFRSLRRSDYPNYRPVVLLGLGKLERSTGLDRSSEVMVAMLSRRSTWFVLGLFRLFGRPLLRVFVALDGERVVGTGMLLWTRNTGYVAGMSTVPEYRGRGIASRILALGQAEAMRRRRDWLVLYVESENETARRVYRKAGYRDGAISTWFVRTGVPPTSGPVPAGTRPATDSEVEAVAPALEEGRAAEYRAAFPLTAHLLTHLQMLLSGRRVEHRTWVFRGASGSPVAVRAYYDPDTGVGTYLVVTGRSGPTAEEVSTALGAATDWLRARGAAKCVAVVSEPAGAAGTALERLGFAPAVSTTVMIRRTSE